MWNLCALVVFMVPHELMRGENVDGFMRPLLAMAIIGYVLLRRNLRHGGPDWGRPLKRWITGFHLLFWAEMVMEAIVFTLIDFHDTDANDVYFKVFWVLVFAWGVIGWPRKRGQNPLRSPG